MPINTVCPECDSTYLLPDGQAGKKVRCKKCQAVFVVADPSARRPAARSDSGKSSAATARRSGVTRRPREDDDGVQATPKRREEAQKPRNMVPWIIAGASAGVAVLVLACGGAIAVWMMNSKSTETANNTQPNFQGMPPQFQQQEIPFNNQQPANRPPANQEVVRHPLADNQQIQGKPVEQAKDTPAKADNPPPPVVEDKQPKPAAANNGWLGGEPRARVKRATVFLRVTMPNGTKASGSGFFGCKEAPHIILTNAHVVGMLAPESGRPKAIEVVVNSGEANEWKADARVLGVDRSSDLAVLDIGKPPQSLPDPLAIKSASGVQELDRVFVSGFPLGYSLGKEISIRDTSVSALRKQNGRLNRIQLNGGMDPGNSGGPIVNANGEVIGVAVSGIEGRQINFAIPGDHVHNILDGGMSELTIHQPYIAADSKIRVPVVMDMIDPRNLIKEVGLEVWTGDKPANTQSSHRAAATKQPAAQPGDSTHLYFQLKYRAPDGLGDILLPELPSGKEYWQQPRWVDTKGVTHWSTATPMRQLSLPVERKPADLVLRFTPRSSRSIDLSLENTLKISNNDDDTDAIRIRTKAAFTETVVSTSQQSGTVLSLKYRQPPSRQLILPDGEAHNNGKDDQFINDLPRLVTATMQLDRLGNILGHRIDSSSQAQMLRLQVNPQQLQGIKKFHERIAQGLEALSVSLPTNGKANPLDSWKAERTLPIDTPGEPESGTLDVTFTYLGCRTRDGRKEAVIEMDGLVRGKSEGIGGRAAGQILVDLNSGQTIHAETTVKLQLEALLSKPGEQPRPIRLLATMKFTMQRKL